MALPRSGTGYQVNDGAPAGVTLRKRAVVDLPFTDLNATPARLAVGFLTVTSPAATSLHLPTATQLDDYFTDMTPGYSFDVDVLNVSPTAGGQIFLVTVEGGGLNEAYDLVAVNSRQSTRLRFLKVSIGVWTLYQL